MSERLSDKLAKDWTDEIPDEEEERPSPYEKTYRDGTAVNERWDADREWPPREEKTSREDL